MVGRYPYVEPSRVTDKEQGEAQLEKILGAGITTFVSLQVGDLLINYTHTHTHTNTHTHTHNTHTHSHTHTHIQTHTTTTTHTHAPAHTHTHTHAYTHAYTHTHTHTHIHTQTSTSGHDLFSNYRCTCTNRLSCPHSRV